MRCVWKPWRQHAPRCVDCKGPFNAACSFNLYCIFITCFFLWIVNDQYLDVTIMPLRCHWMYQGFHRNITTSDLFVVDSWLCVSDSFLLNIHLQHHTVVETIRANLGSALSMMWTGSWRMLVHILGIAKVSLSKAPAPNTARWAP